MNEAKDQSQADGTFKAILTPYRSLSPRGFVVLMSVIAGISFIIGAIFWWVGAWPVLGFLGLDVALIYLAFRLNYRSGFEYELVDLNPHTLVLTRVKPSGSRERIEFNPYWVRVRLSEKDDGRTTMSLASHGKDTVFGRFLNDDERREFSEVLKDALLDARTVRNASP